MLPGDLITPAIGVYVGLVTILEGEKKQLPAVMNIGHCPTFKEDNSELKVEAHILDFTFKELYGKKIKIDFIDRLRDEIKFNSKEELITQIKKDCEAGKKYLYLKK